MEELEMRRAEVEALRKYYQSTEPRVKKLQSDKLVLINTLLKHKPELAGWIKLNFGEQK